MTAIKNTVTEARVLDVMSRLKDAHDHGISPSRDTCQDARECLAYLHTACREWPTPKFLRLEPLSFEEEVAAYASFGTVETTGEPEAGSADGDPSKDT